MTRICLALIIALFATVAQAQVKMPLIMHCGPYDPLAALLTGTHGEAMLHHGTTDSGHEIQQWLNRETGSWSVVLKDKGIGCLVATGNKFTPQKATADKAS